MEELAYQQYLDESNSWLHKGRRFLLEIIIEKVCHHQTANDKSKPKILEIGAGSGKSLDHIKGYREFHAVEIEKTAINLLKLDNRITKLYQQHIPFELNEKYDLIIAMDVIEHIEDDQAAFDWIYNLLNDGGILFTTVPAYQWMFSSHDVALNHYRRYSLTNFLSLNNTNMEILYSSYFNFLLFPLAALSRIGKKIVNKNKTEYKKQSSKLPKTINSVFYSILRIEAKLIRSGIKLPFGLSVVTALKKP